MNRFVESLLFSFFVSMPMVMLDALYHLGTETAVHVNYVLVKITIIFLTAFLVTYWVGTGKNEGIFTTVVGPVIFYLYYLVADATLNRNKFHIDDSFGYVFLHIAVFAISYAVVYNLMSQHRTNCEIRAAGKAFIASLCVIGVDAFYQMGKVQIASQNEELVVEVLQFDLIVYLFFSVMLLGFLVFYYIKNKYLHAAFFVGGSVVLIWVLGQDALRTVVGIACAGIPYLMMKYYLSHRHEVMADA